MAASPARPSLNMLITILQLPTHQVLQQQYILIAPGLHRKLVLEIGRVYFSFIHLSLTAESRGNCLLKPLARHTWREYAFMLGHLMNIKADKEVMYDPEQFLIVKTEA
jgi:hypothetical protein